MKAIRRLAAILIALGMTASSGLKACPGMPFNINDLLRWASPLNWSLLSLGGPTNVTLANGSSIGAGVRDAVVGISAFGSLTLTGSSSIQADVETEPGVTVNAATGTYVSNIHQEDGGRETFLNKAAADALTAAHCMAMLTPTATDAPASIQINGPSENITIHADGQLNVVNLTDLSVTNGTLTLTSNQPSCVDRAMSPANPNCSYPTLIVNISGKFMGSGGKIVLAGGLDEVHVIYNVIGPGDVQFNGGVDRGGTPVSQITGVLFAPYRSVEMVPALVNGSIIAGGPNILLSSGAQIVDHYNDGSAVSGLTDTAPHVRHRQ